MNGVVLFKDIFAGKVNFTDLAHFFRISLVLRRELQSVPGFHA